MKKRLIKLLLMGVSLLMVGCSSRISPKEPAKIEALKDQAVNKNSTLRIETLKQIARSIAAQAALAKSSYQINKMLDSQKRYLDHIFNFNYLILNQNVLPPVLVEGKNALNLTDDFTLRVSEHDYRIVQMPKFVTVPPNWRNYIWMHYQKPETPNSTLLPQNKFERKIWNEYILIGWQEGLKQANEIFFVNLARLKRDYEGMILYRKLLAKNMVTPPYVSQAELGVTGDGNKLHIDDRVLRITTIPQLQTDHTKWHPVLSVSKPTSTTQPINQPRSKLK